MAVYIHDKLNFLSKLTIPKIWNLIRVYTSFYFSKFAKRPRLWGNPITISIEPTTACNLRCPECPSGLRSFTRPTGNLKSDFFRSSLDQLQKELIYLIFYFQGEPYINPEFLNMVKYASDKNIYTITSTNAHFLNDTNARKTIESGLDRLIISIDGTTQDVYQQYRKEGNLKKVIEGTRNIIKWKKKLKSKTPHTIFQFLVVKPNEHQIDDVKKLGSELGVDEVKLKTAQIYDYKNGSPLMPSISKYSRYKMNGNGTYTIKNKLDDHCWRLWQGCVITWDGGVVPCCFDKDAKYRMGDLKESSFDQIWIGEDYHLFRQQILKGRRQIDICTNCTEGTKVWS